MPPQTPPPPRSLKTWATAVCSSSPSGGAVVKNEQNCLIYDRRLAARGLTWRDVTAWWADRENLTGQPERAIWNGLYRRLLGSINAGNGAERRIFTAYGKRYGTLGADIPALPPQVYLLYDPRTRAGFPMSRRRRRAALPTRSSSPLDSSETTQTSGNRMKSRADPSRPGGCRTAGERKDDGGSTVVLGGAGGGQGPLNCLACPAGGMIITAMAFGPGWPPAGAAYDHAGPHPSWVALSHRCWAVGMGALARVTSGRPVGGPRQAASIDRQIDPLRPSVSWAYWMIPSMRTSGTAVNWRVGPTPGRCRPSSYMRVGSRSTCGNGAGPTTGLRRSRPPHPFQATR